MKQFLAIFLYLLDKEDKKRFVGFIFTLMLGGFISLIGIASVIPLVSILIDPDKIKHFPILGTLPYFHALTFAVSFLIIAFWVRAIAGIAILKKQTSFLLNLTAKIQKNLFGKYLNSSYTYHAGKNSSSFISALTIDVNTVSYGIFSPIGTILNEGITSTIIFIALLFWDPVFTISVVGGVALTVNIYMKIIKKKSFSFGKEKTDNYSRLSQCIKQSLGSFKESKIYHKEAVFLKSAEQCAKNIARADSFNITSSQGSRFLIEATAITIVLAVLITYVFLGDTGQRVFVLLSVFGVASVQLLPSINRIAQAMATIKYSFPSLTRLNEEIKQASHASQSHPSSENNLTPILFTKNIQLQDIVFSYDQKRVLNQVSMDIQKGKKIALVGESGAGKTTIADIILGLLTPQSGALYIDDTKLTSENMLGWQALLGYIPQMIYLYDSSIRQNVAFGVPENDIDDEQVRACLQMASLAEFVNALPKDIHTRVGENGIQLSGGQRQRIGIARAQYRNPAILVMDEATAALDNKTETEVTQALTIAGEGRTIITIAHRISTIVHYDVIYYLKDGEVLAKGSYTELMRNSENFRNFVESSALSSKK